MTAPRAMARLTPSLTVQLASRAADTPDQSEVSIQINDQSEQPPLAIMMAMGQVVCSRLQSLGAGLTMPCSKDNLLTNQKSIITTNQNTPVRY